MKREDLQTVNELHGRYRRLEQAIDALKPANRKPLLSIAEGTNVIESGIALSIEATVELIFKEANLLRAQLDKLGLEITTPLWEQKESATE